MAISAGLFSGAESARPLRAQADLWCSYARVRKDNLSLTVRCPLSTHTHALLVAHCCRAAVLQWLAATAGVSRLLS